MSRSKQKKKRNHHADSRVLRGGVNREFKSSLFVKLFSGKRELLSLYNALNRSDYTDENLLQINTIDDVVYMGIKNDVSFIIGSYMNLLEHQSTFCPNMPLRGLLYFSRLYESYVRTNGMDIYGTRRLELPTPRYIIFYNGTRDFEDIMPLKLSDSFQNGDGCIELMAMMYNVNYGHNHQLLESCRVLNEYSYFIHRIRENESHGMTLEAAIDEACRYCIEHDILRSFLLKHQGEVKEVLLTTFDWDAHLKSERQISYEDGLEVGKKEGFAEGKIAEVQEKILQILRLRFGGVSEEVYMRVSAQTDSAVLDNWFDAAVTAASPEAFECSIGDK